MIQELQQGKLKKWNDDKGFGFIAPNNGEPDVFIHISALKGMSRRPQIGDLIVYHVQTEGDGKTKAVNARIEGVAEISFQPKPKHKVSKNGSNLSRKLIAVTLVVLLFAFGYRSFLNQPQKTETTSAPSLPAVIEKPVTSARYQCEGKVHCSEMTSCEEAMFYLQNCPGTRMDGNHDEVPCERQWCN